MYLSWIQQHTSVVFLSSSPHRDQCAGRHRHLFNFRSHGSHLQKAYWKSGERRSDYDARCKKKKKHFMLTLCDIVSSLCRFRPCFYCISRGFSPSAHFSFMVRSVFYHACRHRPGLSVHSDRWDGAETSLSLMESETASGLTRPLLVRRSDHHLHWRFLPWSLWNQTCFNHCYRMCCNLPPGFPLYYTGTALPVWVWCSDMTTDVMTLKMYLCVCVWQAGIYWITLIDTFSSNWVLLIVALAEVIGFIYIYGSYNNFVFM